MQEQNEFPHLRQRALSIEGAREENHPMADGLVRAYRNTYAVSGQAEARPGGTGWAKFIAL